MRRLRFGVAALLLVAGCASEPVGAPETCRRFVDAWAEYDVRCGLSGPASSEGATGEDRGRVEAAFFGEAGCASATDADFRDAAQLVDECVPALAAQSCDVTSLPDACVDQLRR